MGSISIHTHITSMFLPYTAGIQLNFRAFVADYHGTLQIGEIAPCNDKKNQGVPCY